MDKKYDVQRFTVNESGPVSVNFWKVAKNLSLTDAQKVLETQKQRNMENTYYSIVDAVAA